jgi:hypothetical protein
MITAVRHPIGILFCCLGLAWLGCSKPKSEQAGATPQPTPLPGSPPACAMLTNDDIQAVQGETIKSTKPSERATAGLSVSQCYFELPTAANSIVLTITRKAEGGRDPSQSWRDIFHADRPSEKKEEGEEKEPLKIDGVGDEAFWTGTKIGGALYVLKGNAYLRISVGGAGEQDAKIEKSKALAQKVLARL